MAGAMRAFLTSVTLLASALPTVLAQTPTETPSSPTPKRPGWFGGGHGDLRRPEGGGPDAEKFENVRKAIEALTPEQRKRFQENFLRWSNLPPEEKKALADREIFRRKKIAEEIDAALKDSGLELDADRREQFGRRYGEERHRIEEQLHKDLDEKRQPLIKEVIAKLKAEFSTAAPSPSGAPKP